MGRDVCPAGCSRVRWWLDWRRAPVRRRWRRAQRAEPRMAAAVLARLARAAAGVPAPLARMAAAVLARGTGPSCPSGAGTATLPRNVVCGLINDKPIRPYVTNSLPRLSACAADGDCPNGQICFHLAAELGVCDVPEEPPTDAVCEPACAAGQDAIRQAGGVCDFESYCFAAGCTSASDCSDGAVCTPPSLIHDGNWGPGRCLHRFCTSDQDCTAAPGGRCAIVQRAAFNFGCNGAWVRDASIACVYPGSPTGPNACAGALPCEDGCSFSCPATGP